MDIASLVDRIDRTEIRLPEIQRAYVWKSGQITGLLDSLYRRYPSGSLLLWEPNEGVEERSLNIQRGAKPLARTVQYLLDGQQRLTSLHRVISGHPDADVVFSVLSETFRMRSAATSQMSGWVSVGALLRDEVDVHDLVTELATTMLNLDKRSVSRRLSSVQSIMSYTYHVQILDDQDYDEVTEIFVRVNSRGRALKSHDLALATLSARWPGAVARIAKLADENAREGFPDLDEAWILRLLGGVTTPAGTFSALTRASILDIETGWAAAQRGTTHLIRLMKDRLGLTSSKLASSDTSLIPVAAFLGLRRDESLTSSEADGLLYWLIASWIRLRYSVGKETRLGEDLAAIRSADPVGSLLAAAGLDVRPVLIEPSDLMGKGRSSPLFLLMFLICRANGAADWWHGVPIGNSGSGAFKLEYHHVHPRSLLRDYPARSVNEMANLAFISARANRRISNRQPLDYLSEITEDQKYAHFIPSDVTLFSTTRFDEFLVERRRLLADAMNKFMSKLGGAWIGVDEGPEPSEELRVEIAMEHGHADDLIIIASGLGDLKFLSRVSADDLLSALGQAENGLTASVVNEDGQTVTLNTDAERDVVSISVGGISVVGSASEWLDLISDTSPAQAAAWPLDLERRPVAARVESDLLVSIVDLDPGFEESNDLRGSLGQTGEDTLRTRESSVRGPRSQTGDGVYDVWFLYRSVRVEAVFDFATGSIDVVSPPELVSQWGNPSRAATFVVESLHPDIRNPNRNGWKEWKLADGRAISELRGG